MPACAAVTSKPRPVFEHPGRCIICETEVTFTGRHAWFRDHLKCPRCGSIPPDFDRHIDYALADYTTQCRLLETIPGIDYTSACAILIEMGPDPSVFGAASRLAAWAGLWRGVEREVEEEGLAALFGAVEEPERVIGQHVGLVEWRVAHRHVLGRDRETRAWPAPP